MTREVKFRAWDKKKKIWTNFDIRILDNAVRFMDKYLGTWHSDNNSERFVLVQYTGLDDKNGVEIYEGDICKVKGDEPYSNDYITTGYEWEMDMFVDFEDGSFKLKELEDEHISLYFSETWEMSIEVIGNIYENKGLLNV